MWIRSIFVLNSLLGWLRLRVVHAVVSFHRRSILAQVLWWYVPRAAVCMSWHISGTLLVGCMQKGCCRCVSVCVPCVGVFERVILQGRKRKRKWERKSKRRIELNTVHHRWLLFRIPGSWSHAALSFYLTDPVGYELIKRNTSLDIVSTFLSDYRLQPLSTEFRLLQK